MNARPFPVVLAAPSGAGKTTIARALVERHADIVFSISATTRPPRSYEVHGTHYHFVHDDEFDRMVEGGELVEWAHVHGRKYGTPKHAIRTELDRGRVVLLDIDVQGARQIRNTFEDAVLIFILPPSAEDLGRRLADRASEKSVEQRRRLQNALGEVLDAGEFDYIVVNDDFEHAVKAVEAIIQAERMRAARLTDLNETLQDMHSELQSILNRS